MHHNDQISKIYLLIDQIKEESKLQKFLVSFYLALGSQ